LTHNKTLKRGRTDHKKLLLEGATQENGASHHPQGGEDVSSVRDINKKRRGGGIEGKIKRHRDGGKGSSGEQGGGLHNKEERREKGYIAKKKKNTSTKGEFRRITQTKPKEIH